MKPDNILKKEIEQLGRLDPPYMFLSPMREAVKDLAEVGASTNHTDDLGPVIKKHGRAVTFVLIAYRIMMWPERHSPEAQEWATEIVKAFGRFGFEKRIPSFEPNGHITYLWKIVRPFAALAAE